MKTATVRDLRNKFPDLVKWLEWGERIDTTRKGHVVAALSPPLARKSAKTAWRRFLAWKPLGRAASKAETEALWSRLRE